MEVALGRCFLRTGKFRFFVSILVFVEVALGPQYLLAPRVEVDVSILVFVEVALGPKEVDTGRRGTSGFNPCFRGSRPRTQWR